MGTVMKPNVFVLEPDVEECRSITACLAGQGYEVVSESESSTGVATILQHNPGIVLLAEDMPTFSGINLLPLLRERSTVPIIVMGKGAETAVVSALLQGADMYLNRPIDDREMICRVGALLRRVDLLINGGSNQPDVSALENVLPESVKNSLTDTERRLFHSLMMKSGRVVGHEELMVKVWGKPVKKERLRFFVHSLRRKLAAAVTISLNTRNGVGYILEHQAIKVKEVF